MTWRSLMDRLGPILAAVGEGVLMPVGVYLLLSAIGARDVIALTGSAAASVILLGIGWLRTRTLNTLGLLVLIRFLLSLVLVGITNDARLILIKDAALTCATGVAILFSLILHDPFIVRIQRDLAQDKDAFHQQLCSSPLIRRAYHRSTQMWGLGLTLEPILEIAIIYSSSLTTAIILNNTIGTALILSLIIVTQLSSQRSHSQQAGLPRV